MPTFSQFSDADDATREQALVQTASLPAEMVDPADAVGDSAWREELASDVDGGVGAYNGFRFRWDWEMTPSQKARALADVDFRRSMDSLFAESAPALDDPYVDPETVAASVLDARRKGGL